MPSTYDRPQPKTFAGPPVGGTATTGPARADAGVSGRSAVTVWNEDTVVTLRVGTDSTVSPTAGNAKCGIPVPPGSSVTLSWGEKVPVWLVAASSISYTLVEEG